MVRPLKKLSSEQILALPTFKSGPDRRRMIYKIKKYERVTEIILYVSNIYFSFKILLFFLFLQEVHNSYIIAQDKFNLRYVIRVGCAKTTTRTDV